MRQTDGVDEVVTLNLHQFGAYSDKELDVLAIYDYLDELTVNLKARKFTKIINLSHSRLSAMLALLIDAPDVRGFLSNARGERLVKDPWLVYFSSFLAFRRYNRFNLVDVYLKSAGVSPGAGKEISLEPDLSSLDAVRKHMTELGIAQDSRASRRGVNNVGAMIERTNKPEVKEFLQTFEKERNLSFAKVMDKIAEGKGELSRTEALFTMVDQIIFQEAK